LAELRHAARSLAKRPGFMLAVLVTVALGIGSNAAVLGFMNGLVTTRTSLADGSRTTVSIFSQRDGRLGLLSYAEYVAVAQQAQLFEAVMAARETRNWIAVGSNPVVASVATVTREARVLFALPSDGAVVISEGFRQREIRGGASLTEQQLAIEGGNVRVSGVAPEAVEGLYIGRPVDVWLVREEPSALQPDRDSQTLSVVGRLRPDVSVRSARAALDALSAPGTSLVAHEYTGLTPEMQEGMGRLGRLMPAVAGAVFLIACANVAVFLLSRAAGRSHETSLRMALGASRGRLASGVLVESTLIAAAGGAAGLLVGMWTSNIIPALLFEPDAESMTFVPDVGGVLAAAGVSALITLACGMVPLLENRHDTPGAVLRREPRRPSKPLRRLRGALVVFQMSICCALAISAASLSDALDSTLRTRAGERLGRPLLATVESRAGFGRPDLGLEYFRRVEQTVRAVPGITSAAWMGTLPGRTASWYGSKAEPPGLPTREAIARAGVFTRASLDRVILPPKAGRMFGGRDGLHTCRVAILDEGTATAFFGDEAVGRVIENEEGQRVEIVGVVTPRPPPPDEKPRDQPAVYYYVEQEQLPLRPTGPARFTIPVTTPGADAMLDLHVVSSDYFALMGLTLRAGALFTERTPADACRVGVVNEEAAQLYFGGDAVNGAVIDGRGRRTTIVGVVQDARLRSTERKAEPSIYLPMEQDFLPRMHMILGSSDAGEERQEAVRRSLSAVDGGKPEALAVTSLDERLRKTALAPERIAGLLLGAASVNALALGILGLYRVIADDVIARQREIAVRSALGAQRWRLILMVVNHGARVAAAGGLFGIIGALLLARWMYGVTGSEGSPNLWVWFAGPAILALGALVASALPARRILRVDPLTAMREA
jgi:hypothetical protein